MNNITTNFSGDDTSSGAIPVIIDTDQIILNNPSSTVLDIRETDIYVDVSNVWTKMKHNLGVFLRTIQNGRLLNRRIAFGSKTNPYECEWEKQMRIFGYQTRCEIRPNESDESLVDDCIAAHVYRLALRKSDIRVIIVSGDGNQKSSTGVGIYDSVLMALINGISVTVWGWMDVTSNNYKNLVERFPSLFELRFLDEIKVTVTPKEPKEPVVKKPYVCIRVWTKDFSPLPNKTSEENNILFRPLFGDYFFVKMSKSSIKDFHVVYAYFNTEEDQDLAYEYAKKNPFLEIDGVVKELGIEKSSSSMKPKESVRSVLQTPVISDSVLQTPPVISEGILQTPSVIPENVTQTQPVISESVTQTPTCGPIKDPSMSVYSIILTAENTVFPFVEPNNLRRCLILENFRVSYQNFSCVGSSAKAPKDHIFCNFTSEDDAMKAILHFQRTRSVIINGVSYSVRVSPKPKFKPDLFLKKC